MVVTKLIQMFIDRKEAFATVTVDACVSGALRDLGYETRTHGPLKHDMFGIFVAFMFRTNI